MAKKLLVDFKYKDERMHLFCDGDKLYIEDNDGLPYANLSIVLQGVELRPNEFLVKTWSENKEITNFLRGCGAFTDTGRRVQTGFSKAEVWKYREVV